MARMEGKVALVTGAARGQGRSQAVALAREGADLLVLDCPRETGGIPYALGTPDDLRETVRQVEALGRRIIAVEGDVRRQQDLDELVAQGIAAFGRIDVCVANAGAWALSDFWETSEEEWDAVVDICLTGTWKTVKAVTPHMIARGGGSIVLISSVSGVEGGDRLAHYAAAKHGVLGLMKSVCLELGPKHGIRCNAVLPGTIDTDILKWPGALDFMAGGEGLGSVDKLREGTKLWGALKGRGLLSPESTTRAVLFLASDDAADISGLELLVDAGHRILPGLNTTELAAQAAG